MRAADANVYCCPQCGGSLTVSPGSRSCGQEIVDGRLLCANCNEQYPVNDAIPRFVSPENYSNSFGYQWNKHRRTQIDKFNGLKLSFERFWESTKWDRDLTGQKVLEAGSGAGRFTQIVLDAGADVWSFDLSSAVDANAANNGDNPRLHLFQADLYKIPLPKHFFDRVFCFGVLQHCPDVKQAFLNLVPFVSSGGEIAVDFYDKEKRSPKTWPSLYWLRKFTSKMNPKSLYLMVRILYPPLLLIHRTLSSRWGAAIVRRVPWLRDGAGWRLVPILDYTDVYRGRMSRKMIREWSVLDTFDLLSPRYDQPQTRDDVEKWFLGAGLTSVQVWHGSNGVIGIGRKP
jgi:SAM-dependent methyltransferase